jgi:transglutaminase-like putative cysteine protease
MPDLTTVPSWLRRYARPREGWLALAFVFVMLLSLVWSVQRAGWLERLDFIGPVALYGMIAGALLALSPLRVVLTLPLAAVLGAYVVLRHVVGDYFPDQSQLEGILALRADTLGFTRIVVDGGYPPQLTPYAIGLGILMWVTAFIGTYTIYRHHRVIEGILVIGAPLIANMSATLTDLFLYLVIFVFAALLLWLRTAVVTSEEGWLRRRVTVTLEVPGAMMRTGLMFIVLSVILAWVLTSVAVAAPLTAVWNNLDGVWNGVRSGLDGIFSPLNNGESRIAGTSFLPTFRVKGSWQSDDAPVLRLIASKGFYLRTMAYDAYTGHGWEQTAGTERRVEPSTPLFPGETPERPTQTQAFDQETVTIIMDGTVGGAIFTPGFPVGSGAPIVVLEAEGAPLLVGLRAATSVSPGQGYQITAFISRATAAELKEAGTEYPDAIRAFYLNDDRVTEQTRALARSIVERADASSPYEMVEALATYLHGDASFQYQTEVGPPDPDRDLVDFFLFDTERGRIGYCEYYASAMAMMARSLGIPARVATGFAPGTFIGNGTYQVRQKNAHAWAEIYFPGYGWQIFEATKSIDPVRRPQGSSTSQTDGGGGSGVATPRARAEFVNNFDPSLARVKGSFDSPVPGGLRAGETRPESETRGGNLVLILMLVIVAVGVAIWRLRRTQRLWRYLAPGDRQWARLLVAADRAGIAQRPAETIYEYAGWLEEQLPQRRPEIRTIADGKVWQAYSGHGMTSAAIARIEAAWVRLRWPITRLAVRRRIRSLLRR